MFCSIVVFQIKWLQIIIKEKKEKSNWMRINDNVQLSNECYVINYAYYIT